MAYQPFAWQLAWALELADQLLGSKAASPQGAGSLANGVEVIDVQDMQAAFEEHFLTTYEHGKWQMVRRRPEALVRGWTDSMGRASPTFRAVYARQKSWLQMLIAWLKRAFKA